MSGQDGKIWYGLGIDNTQLQADANKSSRIFKGIGDTAVSEGQRMDNTFKKIAITAGSIFATQQAIAFGKSMIQVRGEIEALQISFETLAGKAKGNALFGDIKEWVVSTPMLMQDAAKGAQTLLAFNIEAEKVMPILRQIGDISMGDAQKFNSLTLAFAQMSSTGKLMGQDLLQMINAGFNPLTVIAEKTGKSISTLKDEMSNGAISSQMVADAFAEATAEGGKFHGMLEKQSKGIKGSLSNLQGAVDDMLNDLGTKSQGFITAGIDGATTLVKNYEDIGRVLTVLIATYGAYRAALMATVVIQKAAILSDNIKLVMMFRKELGLLTAAQQAFNIKAMANPYVLLATVIIGACAAIWQLVSAQKAETQAIEDAVKPMREEFTQTNLLISKLKDANLAEEERKKILEELKTVNPDIVKGINNEATAYEELSKRLEAYNKAKLAEIAIKKFSMQDDFDDAVTELTEANDALQSESASIIDVYSTLFTRFREMETQNKDIPADLKNLFTSIIDSSIPETEKVEALFSAYDAIKEKVKAGRGAYRGQDWTVAQNLFRGLDLNDYKDALDEVSDATDDYEEKAKNLKTKIDNIAKSIYTDEKDRQDFIMSQWAIYFPEEVKQVETAIEDASTKTRTWKDDIKDLVSDEYKANIDAATNINEVITFIQKQIKAEQEKVDNMKPLLVKAGFDFTSMSFPAPYLPSAYDLQLQSEYNKSNNSLAGLNSAQKKLNIPKGEKSSGDAVTDKLKTQIDLIKSARDEYNKLLKAMSAEDAFKAIQGSTSYSKVQLKDIISSDSDDDGYMNYLSNMVKELSGRKTKEAKALVAKLNEEIDSIKFQNAYDVKERESEIKKLDADYKKNVSEQVSQTQLDIRQSEIDAMDEGFNKELAVIGLNYDKLIAENQKRQEEWIKALTEQEKSKWLANNPDKGESQFTQTFDVANLTPEQIQALEAYTRIAEQYRLQSEEKLTKDLLEKYRSYEQQRTDINKKFDIERKAIENSDKTQAEKTAAIIVLEKMRGEAIKAVNNEEVASMQKSSDLLVKLFSDASQRSVKELRTIISTTEELLSYLEQTDSASITPKFGFTAEELKTLKESPEKLKALRDALKELNAELGSRSPFEKFASDIDKAIDKIKSGDIGGGLEGIGGAMQSIMPTVKKFGEDLSTIFGDSQIGEDIGILTELIGGVGQGIQGIGQIASGDILGGVTSIVSGIASIFSMANAAAERHKKALEEIMNSKIAQQREYNLLLLKQNLLYEQGTTIFGNDGYGKAINAIEVYKKALADLQEAMAGNEQQKKSQKRNSYILSIFGIKDAQSTLKQIYAGLADIEVVTGHKKTGLFGWGKGKDLYSSVLSVYPDLIKSNGDFNKGLAESIIQTRKMSDEDKASLQNMIDLFDQYEEAMQQVRDYLSGIFGELGNTMSDALVDAFKNGTDAAEAFTGSVSKMLEDLAKQMIYSVTLAPIMEKAQEQMLEVMKNGDLTDSQKFEQYAAILSGMTSDALAQQEFANSLYKQYQDMAAQQGLDIFQPDEKEREASKRGIATASQESVDENNGRLTVIQGHTFSISENMRILVDCNAKILVVLYGIQTNTSHCSRLEKIEKDMGSIKNGIDDINTKGITLKK